MKDFFQLTYRGRARRLRQMALIALQRYDLVVKSIRLLTNETNGIFRVDTMRGEKFVLRITDPLGAHSVEEVCSEMAWLTALRQDTDLDVPEPVTTKKGEMVVTIEIDPVPEPRHCALFRWVPGVDLVNRLTKENMYKLGVFTALLHNHANSFTHHQAFMSESSIRSSLTRILTLCMWSPLCCSRTSIEVSSLLIGLRFTIRLGGACKKPSTSCMQTSMGYE